MSVYILFIATPRIRPGWLPFEIRNRQRMFWPRDPSVTNSFEVQVVKELVFPCRVEGRPKSEVAWQFNGMDIETVLGLDLLQESSANITEVSQGRSVLIINVEVNQDVLSGENVIECSAANAGGSTSGSVILQGICTLKSDKSSIVLTSNNLYFHTFSL